MEEVIPTLMEEGDERIDTLEESSIIAGVQSINGKAGDLDIKTINGQDILTAGNLDLATAEQLATKQDILTAGSNIQIENNVISATDTTYTAGTGLELNGTEFSVDTDTIATKTDLADKQDKLTQTQLTAVNSGIDSAKVTQIGTNQNDISTINGKIPNQASTTNQLADKAFVNSSVQTATANYRGSWADWAAVPTQASDYPTDYAGSTTPTVNDYLVIQDASDYTEETLEGTWRFKYTGSWENEGKNGWMPEYQVNETPMTAAQLAAINSGITDTLVAQISTNAGDIADLQTGKMNANTTFWGQTVQNGAVDGTITLTESGQTAAISTTGHNTSVAGIKMGNTSNYVEAGVAGTTIASNSGNVDILAPSGTVDVHGRRITSLAMPSNNTDAASKRYVDNGLATKQDTLTAGAGITIAGTTISVTDPAPSGFWTGAGTKISEGTDITIQNALATSPKNINLKGGTQQTTYTGKNLFGGLTYITKGNISSYSLSGNTLTITPSSTTLNMYIAFSLGTIIPAEQVHLHSETKICDAFQLKDSDGQIVANFGASINASRTLTGIADRVTLNYVATGTLDPFTVDLSTLIIEKGASFTSYEPFVGGIPSPNPDYPQDVNVVTGTQTVYEVGKNWLEHTETDWSFSTANNIISQTAGRYAQWGKIEGGKYYTMSRKAVGSSSYWIVAFTTGVPNTSTTAIGWARPTDYNVTEYTFETPAEAQYAVVFYGAGLSDEGQLELGSNHATAYEPYHGGTYSVRLGSLELCKIGSYQDYIYTDGTGWWKHKEIGKVVFDGSETWAISGNTNLCRTDIPDALVVASMSVIAPAVSDYFTASSWASLSDADVDYGLAMYYSAGRIGLRNKNFTTKDDYTTWLSTHNTTVYYALETPTDELIVDADLVSDLDALLAAKLATGQNTITNSAVSPNLPAIINVETFENNWNGLSEALLEA